MTKQKKVVSRIAGLRQKLGLTQTQLSVFIGVSPITIQNWESGRSGLDQIEKFVKLCTVLGCKPEELIDHVADLDRPSSTRKVEFSLEKLRELRKEITTDSSSELDTTQKTIKQEHKSYGSCS